LPLLNGPRAHHGHTIVMHTPERKKKRKKKRKEKKRRARTTEHPQRGYYRGVPASIRDTAAYQAEARRRGMLREVVRTAERQAWWIAERKRVHLPGFSIAESAEYIRVVRSVCPRPDPNLEILDPDRLIVRVHRSDRYREDAMMRICGIPRARAARYLRRALHDMKSAIALFYGGEDATMRG